MDPNNEVNKNIASAYLEMLALEEKKKNEGLDPVNKDAVKKNFKDRKDKDIDNDGDEDESDEYLHNRRKTVSKAIDKDGEVDQDKPKVTSSDADSEKDNDDDRDEKGSVLKKDNDKKKTAEQTKESVDGENLKELGLEILDETSKKEGVIDRILAGKPKGGSKHWVTKKHPNESRKNKLGPRSKQSEPYESNESVEPSLLMKRIQEKHGLVEKRVGDAEQNIDTWDKQVSNRRADDILDTEMTEKEFMDMHNVDTPEFVDGPKVANKTMDAIKNSVKSKSATRNNDSTIGESVEIEENRITLPLSPEDKKLVSKMYNKDGTLTDIGKRLMDKPVKEENDMYEGMTPMQRALAKVKAQPKDKVSVKKAPWDKDDAKKESVDLENVNEAFIDNLGDELPYFIKQSKGAETDWYSNINRTMKTLESDLKDRKDLHRLAARPYREVRGHHDASLKAIADVRSKLKNVVKAFDKAFYEASAVDREIIRADKEAAKKAVRK